MKKEYNAMFDKLVPQKSDEELLRAVLSGKADIMNENKKRKRKAIIIPALVAAALCATTVGVSAAYNWNIGAAIEDIFKLNSDVTSNTEPDLNSFDFEALGGKELSDVIRFDGYVVKMRGVAASVNTSFFVYDVVFDENYDYALGEGEKWLLPITPAYEPGLPKDDFDMSGSSSEAGFLGMDGNVAHCFGKVKTDIAVQGKTMVLSLCNVVREKADGSNDRSIAPTETSYTVKFDFDAAAASKVIKLNEHITADNENTGTLTEIVVSPFEVSMHIMWDTPISELDRFYNNSIDDYPEAHLSKTIKVTFKDGTVKDINAFLPPNVDISETTQNEGGENETTYGVGVLSMEWKYPVNSSDIVSVTIGGKTFTVN